MSKIIWNPEVRDITKLTYERNFGFRKDLAPCSAEWSRDREDKIHSLMLICPCGCGALVQPVVAAGSDGWTWDGNLTEPTLSPSILVLSGCRWHGYLTKGDFRLYR